MTPLIVVHDSYTFSAVVRVSFKEVILKCCSRRRAKHIGASVRLSENPQVPGVRKDCFVMPVTVLHDSHTFNVKVRCGYEGGNRQMLPP